MISRLKLFSQLNAVAYIDTTVWIIQYQITVPWHQEKQLDNDNWRTEAFTEN